MQPKPRWQSRTPPMDGMHCAAVHICYITRVRMTQMLQCRSAMQFVGSRSALLGLVATGMRLVHHRSRARFSCAQARRCGRWSHRTTPACGPLRSNPHLLRAQTVANGPAAFARSVDSAVAVYSFGSKNEYQFEHAVREQSACEIHIFDPTSDPPNAMNAAKLNQRANAGEEEEEGRNVAAAPAKLVRSANRGAAAFSCSSPP